MENYYPYLLLYPGRKCASNIGRFAIQIQHTHSLRYPISFSWTTKGPTSARSFFSLTFSISPPAYVVRGWHRFQPRLLVANSSPIVDTRASSSLSFLSVLVNLEESEQLWKGKEKRDVIIKEGGHWWQRWYFFGQKYPRFRLCARWRGGADI